ncbi:cytochrome P450 [Aspergillus lucknowensis]|uniref:Cytochrome P450 n=1 Tax=Aspergillus lucknowensis TaxID=176173 RepID=A0ABR4LFG4_9EURO
MLLAVAYSACSVVAAFVVIQLFSRSRLPNVPIVGAKPGEWFPLLRARWRNTFQPRAAAEAAYNEHREQACIFPMAGAPDFVQLPLKEAQWLIDRPDSEVSVKDSIVDSLQLDHTLMDPRLVHQPAHTSVISGPLTRETANLIPQLLEEIRDAIDSLWGTDRDQPRAVCVFTTMSRVIGQATNRAFVGLPLCRDPALLETAMAFSMDIPIGATLLQFFPRMLRPLVAPLITLPNRLHTRRATRLLRPEIQRRLAAYAGPKTGPNDFLQWSIDQAQSLQDPYFGKVETLAGRILLNNFTSIHTSSFAITHALLDLAASTTTPTTSNYTAELRREITAALHAHDSTYSKRSLAAMPKLDSTLRESQRLNSFVITATNRMVAAPAGVTTPSGLHVPRGTMLCAPAYGVLHDAEIYPEPEEFRAFRFAEKREAIGDEQGQGYISRARQAWTTTSPEYPAFGHGRHACLGRFFASTLLKLILAYVLENYEIGGEVDREGKGTQREENFWFGGNRTPPMKAEIVVRRM